MKEKTKKPNYYDTVHYTIKGRKRFKTKMWLVFVALIIVLLGCSAMFYFGNYYWDPEAGFSPGANPREPYQIALIVLGAVISVGSLVGTFVYCWFAIKKFYDGQEIYFKSKKFKENKSKALSGNVYKLKKSTLKWYKKMGYITGQEKKDILEKKKLMEKKETAKS